MPLRRETVVDAALELLDEVGLDALTTRALTGRLGVRPGALYWHVKDKRELLTAVAERIMAEFFPPAPAGPPGTAAGPPGTAAEQDGTAAPDGGDPLAGAEDFAHAMRAALLRHRDGARLMATHTPGGPAAEEAIGQGLERMRRAGVPLELAAHFGDTLTSYVTGFVLQEEAAGGLRAPAADRERRDAAFRAGIGLICGGTRVALAARSDRV
jgi:TetR/AcrR family transcriptional regulator, tetracycline repressor protein